jgi:intracellular multiplication protein IcmB
MNLVTKMGRFCFDLIDTYHQRMDVISHPGSLSDLNMAVGDSSLFATDNGSLVSVIMLQGTKHYVTGDTHDYCIERLNDHIAQLIKSKDVELCWAHSHDDSEEAAVAELEAALKPLRNVSRFQGLKNQSFFDEQVDILKDTIQSEKTYLCLWTNMSKIGGIEKSKIPVLMALGTQGTDGLITAEALADKHITRVEVIMNRLNDAGLHTSLLSNTEVGTMMATDLDHDANKGFVPRFFGHIEHTNKFTGETNDKVYTLNTPKNIKKGIKGEDYSVIFPPKLGFQLWRDKPRYEGQGVRVGDKVYGSLSVTLPPDREHGFNDLIQEARRAKVPFRVAMKMNSNSRGMAMAKYVLANFLSMIPLSDKTLRGSISQMWSYANRGGSILSFQMTLTTWSDDSKGLSRRLSRLNSAVNAWGGQCVVMSDDPIHGLVSTIPPYNRKNPAPAAIGPSSEALYMAPLTRPALPWKDGGVLFTSKTGKLMPFKPMSELMAHNVYLVAGSPGYGKSLVCMIMLQALIEGQETLPYVAISDVGISSKGLIDYLISILPAEQKHRVHYYSMQNQRDYAINMNDTPLGMRYPLEEQHLFTVQMLFLGVSMSDSGKDSVLNDLLSDAITLAFDRCADTGPRAVPHRFQDDHLADKYWGPIIQPALDDIGYEVTEDSIYWDIVDALFDAGHYRAATMVQRFAVPLIKHIADAANSKSGMSKAEMAPGITYGEYLFDQLHRLEQQFEIMQLPTQLDISEARVVAFNLEDVCLPGSDFTTQKNGTLFFGLTSRLQANKFFWNKERLKEIPVKYRPYHETVVDSILRTKNFYFADEQQRFSSFEAAVKIPELIAAEGRKREIGVMLASQRAVEFSKKMLDLATGKILVGFSKSSVKDVAAKFKLDATEEWILTSQISMPGREGSSMLVQFETEKGDYSHFVNLKVGKKKLWGLSTKKQSTTFRDELVKEFGYEEGLSIISKLYPSCEVESEYERRKVQLGQERLASSGLELARKSDEINEDIMAAIIGDAKIKGKEYFLESLDERSC